MAPPPPAPPARDIAVVLGTRPEIIKLAPLIRLLGDRGRIVHTGQHYDSALSGAFFANFGLREPELRLDGAAGAGGRGDQIGTLTRDLARAFTAEPPRAVVVQGDTNSTSAGAQAAHYCGIPVVHVEAGLRSGDRAMPEEINRLVVGVLADAHCAATAEAAANLRATGTDGDRIRITGNTVVEATLHSLPAPAERDRIVRELGAPADFVLATAHRPENTDRPDRLAALLGSLAELGELGHPVLLPLHPRTRGRVKEFGMEHLLAGLTVVDPVDHPTFLALADRAALLVSDSGGVQEEATVLKKPLLVVRTSTERPEAVAAGFSRLVEPGAELTAAARALLADDGLAGRLRDTPSPYGDGRASERIRAIAVALADGAPLPGDAPGH
ncbi:MULTISPECIES: UDP-N-acetylglucosamine 2-epimerase (non-hydrolyzing) [Kitasatospora]|uniref:Putative UDP-N-acetylglucosamine 2-epimerase n=1 Tax=Kitasatospora setae (strain ATCC 33774 / DSM 43861 / JCM 3304 / KCC A-0304 / NBRC 14216 / KM-6054) TaxID=452652 RepID=E4N5K1_KITSK|nr:MULTISPECIES: UDP-N-acetylglucosamine 2-epimerase (non-hydrolyzing) [Kitasatospora]BAJ26482.1 putative UDP-N-acetylglucosamine 2-epimerase [Kitasatospora setae KM-6054]